MAGQISKRIDAGGLTSFDERAMVAQPAAPASRPANRAFFRLRVIGRILDDAAIDLDADVNIVRQIGGVQHTRSLSNSASARPPNLWPESLCAAIRLLSALSPQRNRSLRQSSAPKMISGRLAFLIAGSETGGSTIAAANSTASSDAGRTSLPCRAIVRQGERRFGFRPWRSATSFTNAPGRRLSDTISALTSSGQSDEPHVHASW